VPENNPKIKLKALREQQSLVNKLQAQYRELAKIEGDSVETDKERKKLIQQISIETKKATKSQEDYNKVAGKTIHQSTIIVDKTKELQLVERGIIDKQKHRNNLAKEYTTKFMSGLEKITDFIAAIPGGKSMLIKMGLGEDGLAKIKKGMTGAFETLIKGDVKGAVKQVGEAFGSVSKKVLGVAVGAMAALAVIKLMYGALQQFSAIQDAVGEKFGAMGLQQFGQEFQGVIGDTHGFAVDVSRAAEGITALTDGFGMGFKDAIGMVGAVTDLSYSLGLSQGEAAGLIGQMTMATGLSETGAVHLAKQAEMLAVANDVAPAKVMKMVANNTEFFAKYGKAGGKNIMEAAIQASKLGIGLDKVSSIMGGLLDFSSSIANEMEASIMIGRDLNYQKARELALNNDVTGAMKEIIGQLGSEAEFTKLNSLQRDALAKSINVGSEELAKFIEKGKEGAEVTGDITSQDFTKLIGKDAISQLTQFTNSMKELAAVFANTVGPTLGWIGGLFAGISTFVNESQMAMVGLKVVIFPLIAAMGLLAARSIYVGIAQLFKMVASIGSATFGAGVLPAMAVAAGVVGALSSWKSSAEGSMGAFEGANFTTNGANMLKVGEGGRPEHVQVSQAAPGGGSMQTVVFERMETSILSLVATMDQASKEQINMMKEQILAIEQGAKDSTVNAMKGLQRGNQYT